MQDRDLDSFPDFIREALSMEDGSLESSVGDTTCQYSYRGVRGDRMGDEGEMVSAMFLQHLLVMNGVSTTKHDKT